MCDSPEWVPVNFCAPEMSSATNTDQGLCKMVTLLHLPRVELLAATASWLSLPGLAVPQLLPQPTGTELAPISSPGVPFQEILTLPQQLPLEGLWTTWAEQSAWWCQASSERYSLPGLF